MQKILSFLFLFIALIAISYAQTGNKTALVSRFDFRKANDVLTANTTINKYTMAYYDIDKAYYEKKVKKYKKLRTVGIVLSSLGGAALAGTIAGTVVLARKADFNDYNYTYGGTYYYTGNADVLKTIGMAVGGSFLTAGLLGPGIPLSIIGAKKTKKYKAKLDGV